MKEILESLNKFTAYLRKKGVPADVADDVLQDALIKAIRNLSSLKEEESIVAWFYQILKNTLLDLQKRKSASPVKAFTGDDKSDDFPYDQILADDRQAICACLNDVVTALDEENRKLINLVDIQERSRGPLAKELGISSDLLRVKLHRARAKLKERLVSVCRQCASNGCSDCTC